MIYLGCGSVRFFIHEMSAMLWVSSHQVLVMVFYDHGRKPPLVQMARVFKWLRPYITSSSAPSSCAPSSCALIFKRGSDMERAFALDANVWPSFNLYPFLPTSIMLVLLRIRSVVVHCSKSILSNSLVFFSSTSWVYSHASVEVYLAWIFPRCQEC